MYVNNPIAADRLRYDVLYHTDLNRTHGTSNGLDLDRLNWSNYDLILLYGDCTSTFKVRSTVALAEIFLTGFLPFSDMLCIDKFCFV